MTNYQKMKWLECELRRYIPSLVDLDLIPKTTKIHWYMTVKLIFPNKRFLMVSIKKWDLLKSYDIWRFMRNNLPEWVWHSWTGGE